MKLKKSLVSIALVGSLFLVGKSQGAEGVHSGKVVSTLEVPGYTYMEIDEKGEKFWIAAPKAEVKVGAKISFGEEVWMTDFKSNSLNRVFPKLLFVSAIEDESNPTKTAPEKQEKENDIESEITPSPYTPTHPHEPSAPSLEKISVEKIDGGYTVEELFTKRKDLNGKQVKVRGKVVKITDNIMGMNWIHIQDGTGKEKENDVVFRTKDTNIKPGSVVIAQGKLETDKDFGLGYFYSVIVEESTFSN